MQLPCFPVQTVRKTPLISRSARAREKKWRGRTRGICESGVRAGSIALGAKCRATAGIAVDLARVHTGVPAHFPPADQPLRP
eukprot:3727766-Rhodomonas_salina.1